MQSFEYIRNKNAFLDLLNRGLIENHNKELSLTNLGAEVVAYLQSQLGLDNSKTSDTIKTQKEQKLEINNQILELYKQGLSYQDIGDKLGLSRERIRQLERGNQILELYKQGLSYQDIGDKLGLSRERIRQILDPNPAFHRYLQEQEKAKFINEQKKKELAEQSFYSKSLAALYPEKVAELCRVIA